MSENLSIIPGNGQPDLFLGPGYEVTATTAEMPYDTVTHSDTKNIEGGQYVVVGLAAAAMVGLFVAAHRSKKI